MMPEFSNYEEAVNYYRVSLRRERDALDDELIRRFKRIEALEALLEHNKRQLEKRGGRT